MQNTLPASMVEPPFFYIMLSTYNRPELVLRAVTSVLKQNYKNYKFIIFNDGSNKDYSKLEEITEKYEIKYINSKNNVGSNKSKNIMIDYAKFDNKYKNSYFFILDDDDYLIDNSLEVMANEIIANPNKNWLCFNCTLCSKPFPSHKNYNQRMSITYKEFKTNYMGDKHHVIKLSSTGEVRFPYPHFKNGYEHIFFEQLPSDIYIVPDAVKAIEYQSEGLSNSTLYNSRNTIPVLFRHILAAPKVPAYYFDLMKSFTPKNILKAIVTEDKYYRAKKKLGLKVPQRYK